MKQFKDPIYGYINVPKTIVKDIIDTAEFQRLRYIKQTSYLPVYSAALHNRFIRSLDAYHLVKKWRVMLFLIIQNKKIFIYKIKKGDVENAKTY